MSQLDINTSMIQNVQLKIAEEAYDPPFNKSSHVVDIFCMDHVGLKFRFMRPKNLFYKGFVEKLIGQSVTGISEKEYQIHSFEADHHFMEGTTILTLIEQH